MTHQVIDIITKNSPHLAWMKDRTVLIVRHGSHAYNTNIEGSDEDFKGIAIPPKEYLFGYHHKFEQAVLEAPNPDASIYNINKFFSLASVCNPNIIEVLFTDPVDHLMVTPIGQSIIDNRYLFLSKRVKYTMCGYAYEQLHRIKQHRRWILTPPKQAPTRASLGLPEQTLIPQDQYAAADADINKDLNKYNFDFLHDCSEPTKIAIKNAWREMMLEIKVTTEDQWLSSARKIGLSDNFIEIMQKERQYRNAKSEWDKFLKWKAKRNPARYALEEKYGYDCKHAYHLVRLLRMCREILTTGEVIVKRPDREELLAIRNGQWSFDKLIDFADTEEKELQIVYDNTNILPRTPDYKKLDQLCVSLVERSFPWLLPRMWNKIIGGGL